MAGNLKLTSGSGGSTTLVAVDGASNINLYLPGNVLTLTDGATINWDVNSGATATVTLGGNRTVAAPTNLVAGAFYALEIIQDATGSRTLTWNSVFKFANGVAPVLSTAASARDYVVFRSNGTNLYEQGRSLGVA
jgi:hypothetical protein